MNERIKTGLKIFGVTLAALGVYLIWPKEPAYQGHSVSYWLKELDSAKIPYTKLQTGMPVNAYTNEAAIAIRCLGAKSLPYIISELRAHDAKWKVGLQKFCNQRAWLNIRWTADFVRRERGIKACQILGPVARPAIPALGEALGYGSGSALTVLKSFGPEAVTALAEALTNAPGCGNPYSTALALGQMGAEAKAAIPSLLWTFEHHQIGFPRAAAARASARICRELIDKENLSECPEVQTTKEAMIRGLSDSKLVCPALEGLAQLGTNVSEAAPLIVRLFQDPDSRTRQLATNALHRVAPNFDFAALHKASASN